MACLSRQKSRYVLAFALILWAAIAQAERPKPKLEILSPGDQAEFSALDVLFRFRLFVPPGDSLIAVRVLVDGRPAAQVRGLTVVSSATTTKDGRSERSLLLTAPPHDCTVTALAETSGGSSDPVELRLRYTGALSATAPLSRPKLYVLAIGVSEYKLPDLHLRFAAKDARDFAAVLSAQRGVLYGQVETRMLLNKDATRDRVLDGLEWLQKQATAKDIAILFIAGHGITDSTTGAYYFLPYDADLEAVKRTMIPEHEVRNTLTSIAGKALLFLDTCHAGKIYRDTQARDVTDISGVVRELVNTENGIVVFAASTGRQTSREADSWGNGAFTRALVEGLSGRADLKKTGSVTVEMLELYVSDRVKELTQGHQTPTTAKPSTMPDFPLAIIRNLQNDDVELIR